MHPPNFLDKYIKLPEGARLYHLTGQGEIYVTGDGQIRRLDHRDPEIARRLLPFINEGNEAYYLVGEPESGPERPAYATAKFGLTQGHHGFVPHAHGSRHYVKSEGHSGCVLFDRDHGKPFPVYLKPGSLIEIPEMAAHAFFNRTSEPLLTLIVNTGLGIYHETYALTVAEARQRLEKGQGNAELERLVRELTAIEEFLEQVRPEHILSWRERGSKLLRRLAELLDRT